MQRKNIDISFAEYTENISKNQSLPIMFDRDWFFVYLLDHGKRNKPHNRLIVIKNVQMVSIIPGKHTATFCASTSAKIFIFAFKAHFG